jgi:hypothetical protein
MIFRFDDNNGIYYIFQLIELHSTKELHILVNNPPLLPAYHYILYKDHKTISWGRNDGPYHISDNAKKYITKVLKNLAFL